MKKHAILATILFVSLALCLLSAYVKAQDGATIWTDKADYSPEETVTIYGSGFLANTASVVSVTRPDSTVESWGIVSDSDGTFVTTYLLDGITGLYTVIATDGTNTATVTFTDAVSLKILGTDGSQHPVVGSEENLGNVVGGTTLDTNPNNLGIQAGGLGGSTSLNWAISYVSYGDSSTLSSLTTFSPSSGTLTGSNEVDSVRLQITTGTLTAGTTYHGQLQATGSGASTGYYFFRFTVTAPTNHNPSVNVGASTGSVDEGSTFTRLGSFTDPDAGDTWTATVNYDDGNGAVPLTLNPDKTFALSIVYPDGPATKAITVTVNDNHGGSGSATITVTVDNVNPTAEAGGPYTGYEGSPISFAGSATDPGADMFTYAWDFDYDGVTFDVDSTDQNPTHTWNDDHSGTVALRVTDDDGGSNIDTASVTVSNVAPTITSVTGDTINENEYATVSGSFTDPGTSDTFTITIDWGEGILQTYAYPAGSTGFTEKHKYLDDNPTGTSSDVYTISVMVTDDDTGSDADSTSVTVYNVAPEITSVTGDTIDENGVATVSGSFTDPGTLDTFTVTIDWGEGSPVAYNYPKGSTGFSETHQYLDDNPSVTPSDVYMVSVTVADDDLGSGSGTTTVTVNNVAPTITSLTLDHYTINENDYAIVSGTFTDPGTLDTFTVTIDWGDGSTPEVFSYDAGTTSFSKTHKYLDDNPSGTASDDYTVTVKVTDDDTGSDTNSVAVTVNNVPPTITSLTGPIDPVKVNTETSISAIFTDPGTLDTHTATVYWGDGSRTDIFSATNPITLTHSYTSANIYTVTLTVTDDDTGSDTELYQYIVVYDPEGGFVTGGGWIWSPKGAYAADPSLEGKATFGFVSKYQKGATVPTGNTEFQFHVGNMNFKSTSYDWLVVSGAKAQFKGTGTINGSGEYKFLLTAIDGGKTGVDQFRIKIWYTDEYGVDHVVYDNKMDKSDYGSDATTISGGSIVIHK